MLSAFSTGERTNIKYPAEMLGMALEESDSISAPSYKYLKVLSEYFHNT